MVEPCIVDGCDRSAEDGRKFCRGHRERATEKRNVFEVLRAWGRSPEQVLLDAALRVADAKDENDAAYRVAVKLLKRAAAKHAASRGQGRTKVARTPDTRPHGRGRAPRGR